MTLSSSLSLSPCFSPSLSLSLRSAEAGGATPKTNAVIAPQGYDAGTTADRPPPVRGPSVSGLITSERYKPRVQEVLSSFVRCITSQRSECYTHNAAMRGPGVGPARLFVTSSVGTHIYPRGIANSRVYGSSTSGLYPDHTLVGPLWEGYHGSSRRSRDTCPESYITKYTTIRGLLKKRL